MEDKRSLKYLAIVLVCSMLDFAFHGLTSAISPLTVENSPSIISSYIGTMGAAALWILIAFSSMAYWYSKYENKILEINRVKGATLGILVAFLWFMGMLESVTLFERSTIISEGVMGLCDSIPVILLCILLGKFIYNDHTYVCDKKILLI